MDFRPTLTRHSHLMSTHRGFFVPGDPGNWELPGNPGENKIQKTPFLPRLARGMYNFATMQFLPLSSRALWQEVDVLM